jgi:tetratricopeptide (TPR) repeat protein
MAKPMLVTLPCVLLLVDVWPLRRAPMAMAGNNPAAESLSWLVVEKLPFFALAAASSVATYLVQKGGGSVSMALSLGARLENAVVAVVRYVGKFLWPLDLAVLYPHPGEWPARKVVACIVIVMVLSAFAAWQFRRRPWITVGWLWFLGTLVPVIGIVQVGLQSMADRYTYVPILGVQIALLWTVRSVALSSGARQIWGIMAVVVLIGLAVRTQHQLGVWKNSFTLFDHAIAVTEKNYLAHDNRGLFLFKAGKIDEAMADYRQALAIHPAYLNSNNNLGHALAQLGRPAEALPFYRVALATNADHLEVRNNLANALSDLGQLPEAMEHYEFVLGRQPNHVNALNGSAVVLAMQNRLPEARTRLEQSLRLAPNNPSALNNLGNVCAMLGLRDDAIRHYRRASELNPNETHALVLIGTLLNEQKKFAEAAESLQRATAKNPANPEAHAQLGFTWAQLGRREEALRSLRTALQLRPDYAQAKARLQALEAMPGKE